MKIKNYITVILMAVVLFGLSIYAVCKPADEYSMTERRTLAQLPQLNEQFTSEFEGYSQDQFPFREAMRTVKAYVNRYALGVKDNHGLYEQNGYISKLEYPTNETAITQKADKFAAIYDQYLKDTDCKTYLSIIHDKNHFLALGGHYPTLDYDRLEQIMQEKMPFADYIDIYPLQELEDFYYTDQHWRQECIVDVAQALADGMGTSIDTAFTEQTSAFPFDGTYSGQSALNPEPDTIRYLTNSSIEGCTVTSYNTGKPVSIPVYDMDKAAGKDGYEMFLNGADALVVIENPNALTDKELVIFRDSFTSSLAPLLISGYQKITLVDLRYVDSSVLPYFVSFDSQDILFCYSSLVLNNSILLK